MPSPCPQANDKRLVELQKMLNDNKASTKALNDAFKEGKITADEYAQGQVRLRQAAADVTQETRVLTAANAAQQKATQAAAGSINQLRAELARGTAAYNALSEAERDNTEAGQALQSANKALSDRLKELEGAVGDTRRNVGNYKESLKDAIKESGFLGGITGKVTEAQEKFSAAQNIAKAAIGGNVTALGFLRLALLATGLGALVVVLGSVVAFLTKSQAGVDLVSRKFAGLKAIVGLVTGVAAEFGETLFKAAENPKQALLDLVEFIEGQLVNRFKAVGLILDGIRNGSINKVSEGLFQLSTGITDVTGKVRQFAAAAGEAAKAGEAIEAENQRILRAERALNVERSQSRARIEELKKLSDDTTKSNAVRVAAAREAARIENGLLSEQLKLQDAKIANAKRESLLDKQQTNDELENIASLQSERADTAQESFTLQTELQNKINGLNDEARQKLDAARLAELQADDEALKQRQDNAAKYLDELTKAGQRQLAEAERVRKEKIEADAAGYARDLAMLERNLDDRRVRLEADKAQGLITQEAYEFRLALLEEGGYAARLILAKRYNQDIGEAERARARASSAIVEQQTAKEKAEYERKRQIAIQFGSEIGSAFSETLTQTGATLESFAARALVLILDVIEKMVLAQVVGATATATVGSLSTPDSILTGGATGIIRAGILTALITAAFEVAKAGLTAAITPPKFATGGVVPGVGDTDSVHALLTPGEIVMTKKASQQYAPLLSALNQSAGGAAFHYASGGVAGKSSPTPDGGFLMRQMAASAIDYDALAWAVSRLPPSELVLTELRSANAKKAKIVSRASLGRP